MERVQGTSRGWKDHTPGNGGGAPARAILPVFDDVLGPGFPGLTYKVDTEQDEVIVVRGKGLTGIVSVTLRDVQVGGNGGNAPIVDNIVVADTAITVTLNASGSDNGDLWGIILADGDGNVYGAPSSIYINTPE